MNKKGLNVYIHIPFCKSKCYYCDFVSYPNKVELIEDYVEAVIAEIQSVDLSHRVIDTVYIGGGTPSILESEYIKRILEAINYGKEAEITIEVNPGAVTKQKLQDYKNARYK